MMNPGTFHFYDIATEQPLTTDQAAEKLQRGEPVIGELGGKRSIVRKMPDKRQG